MMQATLVAGRTIPGFAMGATTAEEEIYCNSGGHRNADDPAGGEVNADTVFWICSMTKMIAHVRALNAIQLEWVFVYQNTLDCCPTAD